MQIYAGTVPHKTIVTSEPVKAKRPFPWVPLLIGGSVLVAVAIIAVTLSSLSAAKARAAQAAAVLAAAQETRNAVQTLWSQTVEATLNNVSGRATAATQRLGALVALAEKLPEPKRTPLLKETKGQLELGVVLTKRLADCHAYGTNILAMAAAATTLETLQAQHEKMKDLSANLTDFAAYAAKFQKTLEDLDARVASAGKPGEQVAPSPAAPSPIPPPESLQTAQTPRPSNPPVNVKPTVDYTKVAVEAYRAAFEKYEFDATVGTIQKQLADVNSGASKGQLEILQVLLQRCKLLAEFQAHLVAALGSKGLAKGWIVTSQPQDIQTASVVSLTLRDNSVIPWAKVPPEQYLHFIQQYGQNPALATQKYARVLLGAAVFCIERGQAEDYLKYRALAIGADKTLQALVEQVLPDARHARLGAAQFACARVRDAIESQKTAFEGIRAQLLGKPQQGSIPFAFFRMDSNSPLVGYRINAVRASPKYPDKPDERVNLSKLALDKRRGDSYGCLASGVLFPPKPGEYTFYAKADDMVEVWLGTAASPDTKRLLISVRNNTLDKWKDREYQKSTPVQLQANTPYFIEVVFYQGIGLDALDVGWSIPGESSIQTIDGKYLAPLPTEMPKETEASGRIAANAWALLQEAEGLLGSARAALAEAESACAGVGPAARDQDVEAALRIVSMAVQKAFEAARKVEPTVAKARPLVQQVVELRKSGQP